MGNPKPQKNPKIHEIPIQLNFDFKHPKKNRIRSRVGILDLMDFCLGMDSGIFGFLIFFGFGFFGFMDFLDYFGVSHPNPIHEPNFFWVRTSDPV